MDHIIEKIQDTENKAAKQIAAAEIEGKSLVLQKKEEITDRKVELELEIKRLFKDAKLAGEKDAEPEIQKISSENDINIEKYSNKINDIMDSLIDKVMIAGK